MEESIISKRLDVNSVREKFPLLNRVVSNRPLIYLDNAATTQKPESVIDAIEKFYSYYNSNIHRGVHVLAAEATEQYEQSRNTLSEFINSPSSRCVNFTKGTTESINLVASSYGAAFLKKGDEILVSGLEHHSNIVPWQLVAEKVGAVVKPIPLLDDQRLDMEAYAGMLTEKVKVVAVNMVSNALGIINPVEKMIALAHQVGAVVLIDAAQAAGHMAIDVQKLDCDFLALSGHKMYGPTGTGILYGKEKWLEKMPVYQGGGEMIKEVTWDKTTFADLPFKFEAGTPNIAGNIALSEAVHFINSYEWDSITGYEDELGKYTRNAMNAIPGIKIFGDVDEKIPVFSFEIDGIHHYDIGTLLNEQGIAIRTGHHCCQPLMRHLGIEGTSRVSLTFYNTKEEVDFLMEALAKSLKLLG